MILTTNESFFKMFLTGTIDEFNDYAISYNKELDQFQLIHKTTHEIELCHSNFALFIHQCKIKFFKLATNNYFQ